MKGKGSGKQPPFDPLKGKGKVEAANRPPPQQKEKEKKDRDVGNTDNTDTCLRMATVYDETQEEEYKCDEEADWTDWTEPMTYDDWSYGNYCD